jgi:hypothetical protein
MFNVTKSPNRQIDFAEDVVINHDDKITFFYSVLFPMTDQITIHAMTYEPASYGENGNVIFTDLSPYTRRKSFAENKGYFANHMKKFCIEYMQNFTENEIRKALEDERVY